MDEERASLHPCLARRDEYCLGYCLVTAALDDGTINQRSSCFLIAYIARSLGVGVFQALRHDDSWELFTFIHIDYGQVGYYS